MRKILVVVDMQNDFIDGSLGTTEAQAIVDPVTEKMKSWEKSVRHPGKPNISITRSVRGKYLRNSIGGRFRPLDGSSFLSFTATRHRDKARRGKVPIKPFGWSVRKTAYIMSSRDS